jgi:hypothetical protein
LPREVFFHHISRGIVPREATPVTPSFIKAFSCFGKEKKGESLKCSPKIPHIEAGRLLQKGTSYWRKVWVKENRSWPNRVSMRELQNLSSTEHVHKLNIALHDQKSKH